VNLVLKPEADMDYYSAIDLHSNNSFLVVIDECDKIIYERRLPNDLDKILFVLACYKDHIRGIAVESTFNWYWLVDGLKAAGYALHLVNTTAVQTYSGLKYTDDKHDARWLAHLLRLEILPTGYIYPRETRPNRDLFRKRMQLVQQRTRNILSLKSLYARWLGASFSTNDFYRNPDEFLPKDKAISLIARPNIELFKLMTEQIITIEKMLLSKKFKQRELFLLIKTLPGIGDILAMTVLLEVGDITRFKSVGNFSSYSRCVESKKVSNFKKKGSGNRKCGNKYLSWAFHEAAHHARVFYPEVDKFYERKKRKTNRIVAIRAVAHKLARACYHVLDKQEAFDMSKAFN